MAIPWVDSCQAERRQRRPTIFEEIGHFRRNLMVRRVDGRAIGPPREKAVLNPAHIGDHMASQIPAPISTTVKMATMILTRIRGECAFRRSLSSSSFGPGIRQLGWQRRYAVQFFAVPIRTGLIGSPSRAIITRGTPPHLRVLS
jgi:hypothetical protein